MAELLISWINDEVQLSKKITNFEEDFANGYLFGEILSKFNQQLNFVEDFVDKDLRETTINNFSMIQPTLATLGVHFDTNIARDIILKKKGTALELLYQLKMALEKVNSNVDYSIFATGNSRFGYTVTQPQKRKIVNAWVKEELSLPKKVTSIDEDFSNGYLIGQILSKFSTNPDNAQTLVDLNTPDVSTKNFIILKNWLQEFGIKLDSQQMAGIISKKKDSVMDFLYMLKSSIDKMTKTMDLNSYSNKGNMNLSNPQKKIANVRAIYDPMQAKYFHSRLNQVLDSQKKIDLDKKLHRFKIKELEWEKRKESHFLEEQEKLRAVKNNMRRVQIDKLQRNLTFMVRWDEKGSKDWQENQKIMRARMEREKNFQERIEQEKQALATKLLDDQKKEVFDEIDNFEKNKSKLDPLKESLLDKSVMFAETNFTSKIQSFIKIRERELKSDFSRKERDKRRRKMIVDQSKAQKSKDLSRREDNLIERLLHESKQESEISYEIWRAKQCKQVIIENKNLSDYVILQKKQYILDLSQTKESNLYYQYKEESQNFLQNCLKKIDDIHLDSNLQRKDKVYKDCKGLVDLIFEITEQSCNHQQRFNSLKFENEFWRDIETVFRKQIELIPQFTLRSVDSVSKFDFVKENDNTVSELAEREYFDYRDGLAHWDPHYFSPIRLEENADYQALKKPLNNFQVGNIMEDIINKIFFEVEEEYQITYPFYLPLKIAIMGKSFSGKSTMANVLAEKYKLELIEIDDLIKNIIEITIKYESDKNQSSMINYDKDKDLIWVGKKILAKIQNGQDVDDELIAQSLITFVAQFFPKKTLKEFGQHLFDLNQKMKLDMIQQIKQENLKKWNKPDSTEDLNAKIDQEIQANPFKPLNKLGFLVSGFPTNVKQAQTLERLTQNYLCEDQKKKTKIQEKMELVSKIVEPTPKNVGRRQLVQGSFDLIFNLEVRDEECLRRAIGRRIDKRNGDKYHLDDNVPPFNNTPLVENLISLEDPINQEIILSEKISNYQSSIKLLLNWFNNFGREEQFSKSINNVYGEGHPEEIYSVIEEVVDQNIQFAIEKLNDIMDEDKRKEEEEIKLKEIENVLAKEDNTMAITPHSVILNLINEVLDENKEKLLSTEICEYMYALWESMQNKYLFEFYDVFAKTRRQKDLVYMRYNEVQKRMIEILIIEDDRAGLVLDFQYEYNKFFEANLDMIEDEKVKEEIHQRVEDLHDKLYDIIDRKKEIMLREAKEIAESQFIEREIDIFSFNIIRLMQAEIDRFRTIFQIVTDYYSAIGNLPLQESPEKLIWDLFINFDGFPPSLDPTNSKKLLRLDTFYNKAIKIVQGEYEVPEAAAAQQKNAKPIPGRPAPVKKPEVKKQPANVKKPGDKPSEQEIIISPLEKEMKEVIEKEKSILRYHLHVLYEYAKNYIESLQNLSKEFYEKLDCWIQYVFQVENNTVYETTLLLRKCVEDERKIQKEILMKNFEVYKSARRLNFLTPPPAILPAKEDRHREKFLITNLKIFLNELKTLCDSQQNIQAKAMIIFMGEKVNNPLSKRIVPEAWQKLDYENISNFVYLMDRTRSGILSYKEVATYFALQSIKIPKSAELASLLNELKQKSPKGGVIGKEAFLKVSMWFDKSETPENLEFSNLFDRPLYLKEILYDVLEKNGSLEYQYFIDVVGLNRFKLAEKEKLNIGTYFKFLFYS